MTQQEMPNYGRVAGPWLVWMLHEHYHIINEETGVSKRIGRVGGPRGNGRGINYLDRARELADERNTALAAEIVEAATHG